MNIEVLKNALGSLDKLLSDAKRALNQYEAEKFGYWRQGEDYEGTYADPSGALGWNLAEMYEMLLVVLEAAEMLETRTRLIESWKAFTKPPDGLEHTDDHPEYGSSSPALTFVERLINGLRTTVSEVLTSKQAWILSRLEAMLWDTDALVHRKGSPPQREKDIQQIMNDYLSACFPDFTLEPQISGGLKNFKADCGISSVQAAIEFKIVHTKQDVAKAFSGIAEDTAAYKGSNDWTRFYAVIYQARPFALRSQFRSDMKRIGATTWNTILVNGPTKKKSAKSKRTTIKGGKSTKTKRRRN